jgi:hypothetical protein
MTQRHCPSHRCWKSGWAHEVSHRDGFEGVGPSEWRQGGAELKRHRCPATWYVRESRAITSGILSNRLLGHSTVIRMAGRSRRRSPSVFKHPVRTTSATAANADRLFVQWGPSGRCGFARLAGRVPPVEC